VVVRLDRRLRLDPALAVEIPEQLLLLGIDADHRRPGLQRLLLQAGDLLELCVAIPVPAHRLLLQRLAPAVALPPEQLRRDVAAHRDAQGAHPLGDLLPRQGAHPLGDLLPRQVGPLAVAPHRIARGVTLQHLQEVLGEGRLDGDPPLPSAPLFRTRPVSRSSVPSSSACPWRIVLGSQPKRRAMDSTPPWPGFVASTAA
jgi:hypothetical protein